MQKANTIKKAKNHFSHYQNFLANKSNKDLMEYINTLQDNLECEVHLYNETHVLVNIL